LSDGEVDHWSEHLSQEEGIGLLACEDLVGVWVLSGPKWVRVVGAVPPSRQEEFRVVRKEVVPVEGGLDHSPSQPWNAVGVLQRQAFNVAEPIVSRYDPRFFHDFRGQRAWAVVEVWGW
jgi:hypothetical protein